MPFLTQPPGIGDVTAIANITDHAIVVGDGGVKSVKESNMSIVGYDMAFGTNGASDTEIEMFSDSLGNSFQINSYGNSSRLQSQGAGNNLRLSALDDVIHFETLGILRATFNAAGLDLVGDLSLSGTVDGIDIATDVAANTLKVTNATHTGEVTGDGALVVADNIIDEANLKLDTGPTNDHVLTADSAEAGGMKWAAPAGGAGLWQTAGGHAELITPDTINMNSNAIYGDSGTGTDLQFYSNESKNGEFKFGDDSFIDEANDAINLGATSADPTTDSFYSLKTTGLNGFKMESDGGYNAQTLAAYSTTAWQGDFFIARRARGTKASPAAVVSSDTIFVFDAVGHDGTGWSRGGQIQGKAQGAPSLGHVPFQWQFKVDDGSSLIYSTAFLSSGYVSINPTLTGSLCDEPASMLTVNDGDVEVTNSSNGLILESPDASRYRVTVNNSGVLIVTKL